MDYLVFSKVGLLGKAAAGIGAATVMGLIVSNVAPQFNSISQVAGGYLGGGAIGAVSALLSEWRFRKYW